MNGQSVEAQAFTRRWAKARQGAMPLPAWLAVCTLIAAMFVFPLVMVALTVLKTPQEASASPPTYFPHQLSLQNFENLSRTGAGLLTYIGNSAGVALGTTLATVVLSTLAGYGFGRFAFAGRTVLFIAVLATMMIPFQAILTPLYVVLFHLGLLDTRFGVMLVYTTFQMPFSVFLMRNAFMQVPRELEEAAVVDGSRTLRTLFNVMIPLVAPGIATVALFAFFTSWNEFLAALILLSSNSKYTLPVLLQNLITQKFGALDWGMLEVGVLVTVVPCILVFLILQRYYVQGLLSGAVK
jgi:multiple sugar transport system permease protein